MFLEKLAPNVFAFPEVAAPGTPPAGYAYIYVKSDGKVYIKDDAGTETDLTAGGGSFSNFVLTADSGTNQTVDDGETVDIEGGTNIATVVGATNKVTVGITGQVAIANGGTGQTTQTAAFDALAPTTTKGDGIFHNGTDNVRLAVGTNGYNLKARSTASAGVAWEAPHVCTNKVYKFGSNQSTTSTTFVDVDATNAAITATLIGGTSKVLVMFAFAAIKATAGSGYFRITDGTNNSDEVEIVNDATRNLAGVQWVFDAPATGSTTYKLQFRSSDANSVSLRAVVAVQMSILEIN